MATWIPTPKDVGFSDYHQDALRCKNPYEPGSSDADLWFRGWDNAEEIAQYTAMAELIFSDTKGECVGCGSTEYTMRELNCRPDQINRCYACTSAMRYQKTLID